MRGAVVTGVLDAPTALELVRVIDAGGRLVPDSPFAGSATPELARDLYRWMVLARRLDQEAYNLQRQGELGLWLSCRGQEAAQIGSVSAIRTSDHIFPAYREHHKVLGVSREDCFPLDRPPSSLRVDGDDRLVRFVPQVASLFFYVALSLTG